MLRFQDRARVLSVDRAIGYAIAMRAWQVPAAVVTTVLIALFTTERSLYGRLPELPRRCQ